MRNWDGETSYVQSGAKAENRFILFVNDYFLGIDRKREYIETIQSHVNDGICAINACIQADICHHLYGEATT